MPAVNPRLTVTIKPEVHATLRRISELTGKSQSSFIGELLESSMPMFERMAHVLDAAAKLKAEGMQVPGAISQGLDSAQARLEQQLGLALDSFDQGALPILEHAEKVSRRGGRGVPAGGERRPARKAPTPMSNRGVTPHGKTLKVKGKAAGQPVVKGPSKKGS